MFFFGLPVTDVFTICAGCPLEDNFSVAYDMPLPCAGESLRPSVRSKNSVPRRAGVLGTHARVPFAPHVRPTVNVRRQRAVVRATSHTELGTRALWDIVIYHFV